MWRNVCSSYGTSETAATETRPAFPAFLRDAPACHEERVSHNKSEGQEVNRLVPRAYGAPIPDVTREPYVPDIAPVAELIEEAEAYVKASDPLMAGMGDGKGEPWVPEKFVSAPHFCKDCGRAQPCNEHAKLLGADNIARPAHYARYVIEPCTFIMANDLPFAEGNVVKYICRWRHKNGREDLQKAKRYIEMILEDLDRKEAGTAADCKDRPL